MYNHLRIFLYNFLRFLCENKLKQFDITINITKKINCPESKFLIDKTCSS